jgi:hypothetical protein
VVIAAGVLASTIAVTRRGTLTGHGAPLNAQA